MIELTDAAGPALVIEVSSNSFVTDNDADLWAGLGTLLSTEHCPDSPALLRDRTQYQRGPDTPLSEWTASFEEFRALVFRMDREGLFRKGAVQDLEDLTRAIWIIGRHGMDYLHDAEGRKEISWDDQQRCVEHHFAVLLPCLTTSARKQFEAALADAAQFGNVQT